MNDQLPAAPDENTLVIPDEWLADLIPRRGGTVPVPDTAPEPSACETIRASLDSVRETVHAVLAHERTEAELAEAGLAFLTRAEPTPLGAAVVVAVAEMARSKDRFSTDAGWIDFLVTEHGLTFAARALVEIETFSVHDDGVRMDDNQPRYVQRDKYALLSARWATGAPGRRMRILLAAADDDTYAEVVEALAGHRREPRQQRVVSFLVPTRTDWVEECCANPPERNQHWTSDDAELLWWSLGTAEQVERLGEWAVLEKGEWGPWSLYTIVAGLGTAAAPVLARSLDQPEETKDRRRILDALSRLPSDEAFRLMGGLLDQTHVLPAMEAMIQRFPRRALRVLPELSTGTSKRAKLAAGLLHQHLLAHPGLAAEVLPELAEEARAAVEAVQAARLPTVPESEVPKALRKGIKKGVPDWAPPAAMPQILLRGREYALPDEATGRLIEALGKASTGHAPTQALREALDALDAGSLAEFGWTLFDRWRISGESTRIGWAMAQLWWTGDDETARRLGGMARSWPGQDGIKLPLAGLDVLAAMATDVAVMQLHLVAEKARPKRLKNKAGTFLVKVAEHRGLTMDQLRDRMVPHFGLDAEGGLTLDYGPRTFRVGFDEQLQPQVTDDKGKLRKSLPKPGAADDPELAPAAYRAFTGLKKDVRTVAADQIRRMERAMVEQRRWGTDDFRRLFVAHPLLWHLVRRLVWLHEEDGSAGKTTVFRVAEDRTFADVDDEVLTLPESGHVRIAHPLNLGEHLAAWSEIFADYEILQPFPQLGRPVHALTEEERAGNRIDRVNGRTVRTGKVLGLERQGWERGPVGEGGGQTEMVCEVPGGTLVLWVSPGFYVASPGDNPEQELGSLLILDSEATDVHQSRARFGDLDDVTASELLLTLSTLTD